MLIFSKLDIDDDRDRENDESNLSIRPVVRKRSRTKVVSNFAWWLVCIGGDGWSRRASYWKSETEIHIHRLDIANKIYWHHVNIYHRQRVCEFECECVCVRVNKKDTTYGYGG